MKISQDPVQTLEGSLFLEGNNHIENSRGDGHSRQGDPNRTDQLTCLDFVLVSHLSQGLLGPLQIKRFQLEVSLS